MITVETANATTDEATDEALFDCWLHGKDEAFQLLEVRHRRGIEYFVNHFLIRLAPIHLPATAKLVTEVFRRVAASDLPFGAGDFFLPFLYSVARRVVLNHIRERRAA